MYFMLPPYLDPGSGGFLIQLLIAAVMGCGLCGTPAAAIAAILAFFHFRGKKPNEQTDSVNKS
jgi:hypothetical protein